MSPVLIGVAVGVCVAAGQLFFALLVRGLAMDQSVSGLLKQVLSSPWFYLAGCIYLVGIGLYAALLRNTSLVQANLVVIVAVVLANAVASFLIGERLNATQWVGVSLAIIGVALLRA